MPIGKQDILFVLVNVTTIAVRASAVMKSV